LRWATGRQVTSRRDVVREGMRGVGWVEIIETR